MSIPGFFILPVTVALAFSCTALDVPSTSPAPERLLISAESTRMQLDDKLASVWNYGDLISVFLKDGVNTRWKYTGQDKAASGYIEYDGDGKIDVDSHKSAVFPYSSSYSLENGCVKTIIPAEQTAVNGSYSFAVLTAVTDNDKLFFRYANAFIRLKFKGSGTIDSITVKADEGEKLCGEVTVNLTDASAVASGEGHDSVLIKNENGSPVSTLSEGSFECFVAIIPGSYKSFTVTAMTSKGEKQFPCIDIKPFSPGCGEYVTVVGFI